MKRFIVCIVPFFFLNIFTLNARIIVFYAPDCEDCYRILTNPLFESLKDKEIVFYNINKIKNYELLLRTEGIYKRRSSSFPVIISGSSLFSGDEVIPNLSIIKKEADKTSLPDSLLRKGTGEDSPHWEEEVITQIKETSVKKRVNIAFFTKSGCRRCDRVDKMLLYLKKKYSFVDTKIYDTMNRENQKKQEAISIAFNMPENKRLIFPTIFFCDTFLIGDEITEKKIEKIITEKENKDFVPPWVKGEEYENQVGSRIVERFKKFGPLVVFFAGLVDGVNPCAFATIVFFLSFMAIIGRTKREIMFTGITFITLLFIVYLFIGLFFYRILGLKIFVSLRHLLYYIIAAFTFVLAVISLMDAIMLAKGRAERTILKLPKLLKRKMERTIIKESKLRSYIITAIISAVVVSFLEFTCTGQVYIPTIFFVSGISNLRLKAALFLILYNLAFIVPIFLLFLFFVIGLSSERLYSFMRRRTFLLKIATAIIFFILGTFLLLIK